MRAEGAGVRVEGAGVRVEGGGVRVEDVRLGIEMWVGDRKGAGWKTVEGRGFVNA